MRTDSEIKQDVLDELKWQPRIDETQIGVIVDKGIVTLTGVVDDYQKKLAAEKAVKKVLGVKAVAEDIELKYRDKYLKTDKEIAKAVVAAFEWNTAIPEKDIHIELRNGWVFLNGEVRYDYQRKAAKRLAQDILGVKGVVDKITVNNNNTSIHVKENIANAFERLADIDAANIKIEVKGNTVVLCGKVNSLAEKEEADRIAYAANGVYRVENDIEVIGKPKYAAFDFVD